VKLVLHKAEEQLQDDFGVLTKKGIAVVRKYASRWVKDSKRDLDMERQYPDLAGLFYDIRSDAALARRYTD
jgi:hypothetical protein